MARLKIGPRETKPCRTDRKDYDTMKRLKHKILSMEANTQTYTEMYEGSMSVHPYTSGQLPWEEHDSTYYREDIGFFIERGWLVWN